MKYIPLFAFGAIIISITCYCCFVSGGASGFTRGINAIHCPDTCVVCGMKLNNAGDKEFILVVSCFEDNTTRGRLIKEVKKLKK